MMFLYSRKLLIMDADVIQSINAPPPSSLNATSPPRTRKEAPVATMLTPMRPAAPPFDSSMALTILVLVAALFLMGFFSVYIRRFADDSSVDLTRRRRRHRRRGQPSATAAAKCADGLDPAAVLSLPVFFHGGAAKAEGPTDCPVCLQEFESREAIKMIPTCRHVFHPLCIDRWLSQHVSCPLCRTSQILPAAGGGDKGLGGPPRGGGGGNQRVLGQRSTDESEDTRREGEREVGRFGLRRSSSRSSLTEAVPSLRRTASF